MKKDFFRIDVPLPLRLYLAGLVIFALGFIGKTTAHTTNWNSLLEKKDYVQLMQVVEEGIPAWPFCLKSKGVNQKLAWFHTVKSLEEDIRISKERLQNLKKLLTREDAEDFVWGRQKYQEEIEFNKSLEKRHKRLLFHNPSDSMIAVELSMYLLIFVLFWITSTRLSQMSLGSNLSLGRWKLAFTVFLILFAAIDFITLFLTSVQSQNKLWIGTTSFFVSWKGWLFEQLSLLGLNIFIAIPITQLWCYTRSGNIPEMTSLTESTTQKRFGQYVSFMQVWTTISIGIVALFSILFLKWSASQQDQFEEKYLIIGLCAWGILFFLICRMIRNALIIRNQYQAAVFGRYNRIEEIKGIMPDPTIPFIGENWWKLPATFLGILSGVWAIFQLTGVSNIITGSIK